MAKTTTYTHEDNNGDLHEYDVEYTISKADSGNYGQPPEPAEVQLLSVTENGKSIEITERLTDKICSQIFDDEDGFDGYED
jgi:hypothetical protein